MSKLSILNPLSKLDHGVRDFKTLNRENKALVITVTALVTLVALPFFIAGGFMAGMVAFRMLSKRFIKPIAVTVVNRDQGRIDDVKREIASLQDEEKRCEEALHAKRSEIESLKELFERNFPATSSYIEMGRYTLNQGQSPILEEMEQLESLKKITNERLINVLAELHLLENGL